MVSKKTTSSKLIKIMSEEDVGDGRFNPTPKDISRWFGIINREVFDALLPKFSKIEIRRRRLCWGEVTGKTESETGKKTTLLSLNNYMVSKKHFVQILAHEMVHLWEYMEYDTMGHGDLFNRWKEPMEKHNIRLTGGWSTDGFNPSP